MGQHKHSGTQISHYVSIFKHKQKSRSNFLGVFAERFEIFFEFLYLEILFQIQTAISFWH